MEWSGTSFILDKAVSTAVLGIFRVFLWNTCKTTMRRSLAVTYRARAIPSARESHLPEFVPYGLYIRLVNLQTEFLDQTDNMVKLGSHIRRE